MKKEKQQKRPKRTKAQRVQALKTFAVDTVYDVVGSILFAIGVYTFAKSADFAPGGVSGLALICNYLWDLPIGTMTLIINIPIIIISYKVVGRKFLLKSFKTMVISTLFLDLVLPLTPLYTGQQFPGGHFFRCVYGRRSGADLYARLVHRRHGFPHRHHQKA
ncbi:MAG: YitT family protein [Ruthenibacterium lactatiformans]